MLEPRRDHIPNDAEKDLSVLAPFANRLTSVTARDYMIIGFRKLHVQ